MKTTSARKILSFLTFIILFSCSNKEETVLNRNEMFLRVIDADRKASLLNSMQAEIPITCEYYDSGCIKVYRGIVIGYEVLFVHFEKVDQAVKQAEKKKTLYLKNWVFDFVTAEKVLVKFFQEKLDAKIPNQPES